MVARHDFFLVPPPVMVVHPRNRRQNKLWAARNLQACTQQLGSTMTQVRPQTTPDIHTTAGKLADLRNRQ
ncbi:hypothetical protein, partial [Rhodococcus sp. T2V]|uniref:hypothetical protein n=1 Tax=Rhodococcus sp. T2V TaxID=3034164 RepID=UPI0023E12FF1